MIKKEQVQHIAKLARIQLNEKEEKKFQKELSSVLDYFELLKEVDTKNVEPTLHSNKGLNIMREDRVVPEREENVDKLISLAPDKKARHIKVKAIFK